MTTLTRSKRQDTREAVRAGFNNFVCYKETDVKLILDMKKISFFLGALCAGVIAFGQVKVDNDGILSVGNGVKLRSSGLYQDLILSVGTGVYSKISLNNTPSSGHIITGVHGEAHS